MAAARFWRVFGITAGGVVVCVAGFLLIWWLLAPKGPWVAPLRTLGCQGMRLETAENAPKLSELTCLVYPKGAQAPTCDQVMATYAKAVGSSQTSVRVNVSVAGTKVCTKTFAVNGGAI